MQSLCSIGISKIKPKTLDIAYRIIVYLRSFVILFFREHSKNQKLIVASHCRPQHS
jgi:hypothetical protein